MSLHPIVQSVTERIRQRSAASRRAYLDGIARMRDQGPLRGRLSCANLAHGFAASGPTDKQRLRAEPTANIGTSALVRPPHSL